MNKIICIYLLLHSSYLFAWIDPEKDKFDHANEAYKEKKYEDAGKIYKDLSARTLKSGRRNEIAHFNAGNSYFEQQKYNEAIQQYSEAAKSSDPNIAQQALNNMGNAYQKLGNKPKALESYRAALSAGDHDKVRRNIERLLQAEEKKDNKNQIDQNNSSENSKDQNQAQSKTDKNQQNQNSKNQNDTQKNKDDDYMQGERKKEGDGKSDQVSESDRLMAEKTIQEQGKGKVRRRLPMDENFKNDKPY